LPVAVVCHRERPNVEVSSTVRGGYFESYRVGPCVTFTHKSTPTQAGTRETSVDRNDFLWACGRKVLAEYRGFVRGMRKDCDIYGEDPQATPRTAPQAAGTSGN
jgi:hypothetical protein